MLNYDPDGMTVQDFIDYWQGYIFINNPSNGRWYPVSLQGSQDLLAEHFAIEPNEGYCSACLDIMEEGLDATEHDCEDYWVSERLRLPHEILRRPLSEAFRDKPEFQAHGMGYSLSVNPITMWTDPNVLTHSPRGGYIRQGGTGELIYLRKQAPRSRNRGVQFNTYVVRPAMTPAYYSGSFEFNLKSLAAALAYRWGPLDGSLAPVYTGVLDDNTACVFCPSEAEHPLTHSELAVRMMTQRVDIPEEGYLLGIPADVPRTVVWRWPWRDEYMQARSNDARHLGGLAPRGGVATLVTGLVARMNAGWPIATPGNTNTVPRRDPIVMAECSRLIKEKRMLLLVDGELPCGRARTLYENQIHNAAAAAEEVNNDS